LGSGCERMAWALPMFGSFVGYHVSERSVIDKSHLWLVVVHPSPDSSLRDGGRQRARSTKRGARSTKHRCRAQRLAVWPSSRCVLRASCSALRDPASLGAQRDPAPRSGWRRCQNRFQLLVVDRLDQVLLEAGLAGVATILFLTKTRQGDQSGSRG